GNRSQRIPGAGQADLSSDAITALSQQGDQERELQAGDERRRKHDKGRNQRPAKRSGVEADFCESAKRKCQQRNAISEREGDRQTQRFQAKGERQAAQRGGASAGQSV